MRAFFVALLSLSLCGCFIVYRLPTRQGNVIEQKQLDQLRVGQHKEQVRYLMGTPVASSVFRDDRWDYLGYYRSPRGEISSRLVTLYFSGDKLARMDGITSLGKATAIDTPDTETLKKEEQKDANDRSRAEGTAGQGTSGIKIPTP